MSDTGVKVSFDYEAIRFGVKSVNDVSMVVGLVEGNIYTVKSFLPGKYGYSPVGDAWQIIGNSLIHA